MCLSGSTLKKIEAAWPQDFIHMLCHCDTNRISAQKDMAQLGMLTHMTLSGLIKTQFYYWQQRQGQFRKHCLWFTAYFLSLVLMRNTIWLKLKVRPCTASHIRFSNNRYIYMVPGYSCRKRALISYYVHCSLPMP